MKIKTKTTYMILGTALAFSSCSQEELPYNGVTAGSDRKIAFRSSLPEVSTRAKELLYNDMTYFRITAFDPEENDSIKDGILREYIKNDTLFKDNESGRFFSEDCLWPEIGKESHKLHFFTYYPHLPTGANLVNNTTVTAGKANVDYRVENFRISPNIAEQIDFVTAYASGSMDDNVFDGINLNFKHQLSRIEVMAKSANKSCKLEIAGLRIGGIRTEGTYNFKAEEGAGDWTFDQNHTIGIVEYIYRPGDKIVALDNSETAVSIMGGSESVNYAMLLPASYPNGWDFANDYNNSGKDMYISVLLRILDKTPNGNDKQQYPYFDNSQGLNAMNIPRVYLAVDNNGIVRHNPGQLYKGDDGKYYTSAAKSNPYNAPEGCEVKEFGWAALPVTGNWEAGNFYTYTLDYTSGVGLHDPSVGGTLSPRAGDPIISDRVGVSVSVNDWQGLNGTTTHTVDVPGS